MNQGLSGGLIAQPGRARAVRTDRPLIRRYPLSFSSNLLELRVGSSFDNLKLYVGADGTLTGTGGMACNNNFSCSSIFLTNNIQTSATYTASVVTGYWATASGSASTALIPIRYSPTFTWTAVSWNTTSTSSVSNTIDSYLIPTTGSSTSATLVFANRTVDGVANSTTLFSCTTGGVFTIPGKLVLTSANAYATDAAADADAALPSGSIYTITGSRAVYRKP